VVDRAAAVARAGHRVSEPYGVEREPVAYEPPTPEHAELQALSRYRDALVRERTAAGNRAEEGSASRVVRRVQAKRLRLLDGDLRRFHKARQLTAFAGVSPRIYQSGTSVNGRPRMCKKGSPRVRHVLYLAALTTIRGNNDLQRTYQRLLDEGKLPMVAIGAVMRKLLIVMRALLITETTYGPDWKLNRKRQPTCA